MEIRQVAVVKVEVLVVGVPCGVGREGGRSGGRVRREVRREVKREGLRTRGEGGVQGKGDKEGGIEDEREEGMGGR